MTLEHAVRGTSEPDMAILGVAEAPLSQRLKERTKEAHEVAERSPFMGALINGTMSEGMYLTFLSYLEPVYRALEAALYVHRRTPIYANFDLLGLHRLGKIQTDRAYFEARLEQTVHVQSDSVCFEYASRLQEIGRKWPELLAAHAYTRYLGDLSGGQILSRSVNRAFDLPRDEGTAFYDFSDAGKPGELKRGFRAWIDGVSFTESELVAICDEAVEAFILNDRLAQEVWDRYGNSDGERQ